MGTSSFHTLNTAYTGLTAHQLMVDTAGHNIANAENEGYTRQRVNVVASQSLTLTSGEVGQGVTLDSIVRIHDEFTYQRYNKASMEKEFASYQETKLKEVSSYMPDIEESGIYKDLQNYFNAWETFSTSPEDNAQKINLAQKTIAFTDNVQQTRDRLADMQRNINDELIMDIKEVNRMGERIAEINGLILDKEANDINFGNDLRDERDRLETAIMKMMDVEVSKQNLSKSSEFASNQADFENYYNLSIGGFSFIDGKGFRPLVVENKDNANGMVQIYFRRDDWVEYDITNKIKGGEIGGILALRGDIPRKDDNGFENGKLQGYIDSLDSLAETVIEKTNSLYAESATTSMQSNDFPNTKGDVNLYKTDAHINNGTFDIIMYDIDGNEASRKTITISTVSTMDKIANAINKDLDDNNDLDSGNDIDDEFTATYIVDRYGTGTFQIKQNNPAHNYTIAIEDNGTNFAGALGLNRFIDGKDAKDIKLHRAFIDNATLMNAYKAPVEGDMTVANNMQQLQYERVDFFSHDRRTVNSETISGFYKLTTVKIATDTNAIQLELETKTAVFQAVEMEQDSISKVNIDEELTNLMRFQTGYTANAKVITTIDQMLETLLGLKR